MNGIFRGLAWMVIAGSFLGIPGRAARGEVPQGVIHSVKPAEGSGLTRIAVAGPNAFYLASDRGQVWKWRPEQKALEPLPDFLEPRAKISNLHWSPDRGLIVQAGTVLKTLPPDGEPRQVRLPPLALVALSPAGNQLAAIAEEPPILFFSVENGAKTHRVDRQVHVDEIRYSPTGRLLATARYGVLYVWDSQTGVLASKIRLEGNLQGIGFTPDESQIFAVAEGDGIWVVDTKTGRTEDRWKRPSEAEDETSHRLAFSRDGSLLAESYGVNRIQIWETFTGRPILSLGNHPGEIADLQFLPGGLRLISADARGEAYVWDLSDPSFAAPFQVGKPYSSEELGKLWQMLGDSRGQSAWTALIALKHRPDQAIALIDDPPNDDLLIQQLIERLDHDQFSVRQTAYRTLRQLSLKAEPLLRKTISTTRSAEVTARIRRLLQYLSGPDREAQLQMLQESKNHRQLRLVQLLKWIGTPEARQRLETLHDTVEDPLVKTQAQGALKWLDAQRVPAEP